MKPASNLPLLLCVASLAGIGAPGSAQEAPPEGWGFHNPSGDYVVAKDPAVTRGGLPGMSIHPRSEKSFEPNKGRFGILFQTISAERYRGKRIRFSAFVKYRTKDVWADAWLRVDPTDGAPDWYDAPNGKPVGFDRVELKGDSEWKGVEIVLEVPKRADTITFGYSLYGDGVIWANGLRFETVDKNVPVTDHEAPLPGPTELF